MPKNETQLHTPILRTKLHRPVVPADFVHRARLHELIDLGLQTPLTLVSAPAGYGKSVLVSDWAESLDHRPAWLSLDAGESDLGQFLAYFLAAVESAFPDSCPETATMLKSPNLSPAPALARTLANEMDALDAPLVLVLDDYHRIEGSSAVHAFIARLLEHPPEPLHLVLLTRRDPPLPLISLRAGSLLTELRLRDLRFTPAETAELLASTLEVAVGEDALVSLEREVEGWAAGLRLVTLSLRHVDDPSIFINSLAGGVSISQQYLFQEVLAGLASEVRDRLMKASILDRFCAGLLEVVWGVDAAMEPSGPSGREFLDLLQRSNLFTIPLDAHGEWFRCHHLFQDLLRRQLEKCFEPSDIAAMHSRAGEWLESRGLVSEAIGHALAAGDVERAADIVERHRNSELNAARLDVVGRWLAMLPAGIVEQRPQLLLTKAWFVYSRLEQERVAAVLEQVDSLLQEGRPLEPEIAGEIAFFKGYLLYWRGQAEASVRFLEESVKHLAGSRSYVRRNAEVNLALARCLGGKKQHAIRGLEEQIRDLGRPDAQYRGVLMIGQVAVHLIVGDLVRARAEAQQQLQPMATEIGAANVQLWTDYLLASSCLHAGDLEAAARHYASVRPNWGFAQRTLDALAGLALAHQLNGRNGDAAQAASRMRGFALETTDPFCLAVADSFRARLALLQGDVALALELAQTPLRAPTPFSLWYWLEVPWITKARVLVAAGSEGDLKEATERLSTLREQCETWHFGGQLIDVAVLQALCLEKQGRADEATSALAESVALAQAGGWVRPFVEAGPIMADMLRRLRTGGDEVQFVERVLAIAGRAGASARPMEASDAGIVAVDSRELDALTHRELQVLELLAARFQNKEIAERLFISSHTVNDHLKQIYEKLGAHRRREAVDRAVELGILNLTSSPS